MAISVYSPLLTTLRASAFLAGVSVVFGEEMVAAQDQPLPMVVVVPRGGPWEGPGYVYAQDPSVENTWATKEAADLYLWGVSLAADAQPVDHADAVYTLMQNVLSAFQDQRNQAASDGSNVPGLYWKPVSGRWEMMQGAVTRYGRAYVLTIMQEIALPMVSPVEATITSVTTNQAVLSGQHVA